MPRPNHPESRGRGALILLVLLVAGFVGTLLWMLNLRLGAGDVQPPLSSLRSDPLGTRALYEALDRLPGVSTERNIRNLRFLEPQPSSTILLLGLSHHDLTLDPEGKELDMIDRWLDKGCRIVISLAFADRDPWEERQEKRDDAERKKKNEKKEKANEAKAEDEKQDEPVKDKDLPGFLGLTAVRPTGKPFDQPQTATGLLQGIDIPAWRGSHILKIDPKSKWKPAASMGTETSVASIERSKGMIIVTTDGYPFSNEAQRENRHSALILSYLGTPTNIIFDESHLGVVNEPGLMQLIRRFHLHGIVAGGLLIFAFLLWQGAGSLIPVDPNRDIGSDARGAISGRDSTDGLVALLEQGLKPRALLEDCIQRHAASTPTRTPDPEAMTTARTIAAATRTGRLAEDFERIAALFQTPSRTTNQPDSRHGSH